MVNNVKWGDKMKEFKKIKYIAISISLFLVLSQSGLLLEKGASFFEAILESIGFNTIPIILLLWILEIVKNEIIREKDNKKISAENSPISQNLENDLENAERLLKNGEFLEADTLFRKVIKIDPQNYRCWIGMAKVKSQNNSLLDVPDSYFKYYNSAIKVADDIIKTSLIQEHEAYQARIGKQGQDEKFKYENTEIKIENDTKFLKIYFIVIISIIALICIILALTV
jgi:tetratricopeptide (TPR) repeat protein